ncbi:MAG: hypothetical protein J2P14_03200 [Acidothermales bacterium]|nr:hypothetical protein [Acidothermales bacterium]
MSVPGREGYQRRGYERAELGIGMITTHLTKQKALMVLLSLGLVALIVGLDKAKQPDIANMFAPSIKHQAALGQPLTLREGTVRFTRVRAARSVETGSGILKKQINTSGIWVIVDYRFTAVRQSANMDVALNSRDNATYAASDRGGLSSKSSISGDPGFPVSGSFLFEMPKSRIAGSYITVGQSSFGWPLWDDEGIVPLGVDDAGAKTLIRNAPPLLHVGGD